MTRRAAIAAIALAALSQARGEWVTEVVTQDVSAASYVIGAAAIFDGIESGGLGINNAGGDKWYAAVGSWDAWNIINSGALTANAMTFNGLSASRNSRLMFPVNMKRTYEFCFNMTGGRILLYGYGLVGKTGTFLSIINAGSITQYNGWTVSIKPSNLGFNGSQFGKMLISVVYQSTDTELTAVKCYVNGVESPLVTGATSWSSDVDNTTIGGRSSDVTYNGQGEFYCMRFYDRELSAEEVRANYALDRWRFLEGHGNSPMMFTNRVYRAPAPMRSYDAAHPFNAPTARTRLGGTGSGEDGTTLRPTAHFAIKKNEEE